MLELLGIASPPHSSTVLIVDRYRQLPELPIRVAQVAFNGEASSLMSHRLWQHGKSVHECYTGIQGLNYPELPSRGILGNKEIILFDCMCELCGYE